MDQESENEAPKLQTERVWLSSFSGEDAPAVFDYSSIPNVSRYTTWGLSQGIEEMDQFLEQVKAERYCWAIRTAPDGPPIGSVACSEDEPRVASIHFALAERRWERGLIFGPSSIGWTAACGGGTTDNKQVAPPPRYARLRGTPAQRVRGSERGAGRVGLL